jgi:hypothetical protein
MMQSSLVKVVFFSVDLVGANLGCLNLNVSLVKSRCMGLLQSDGRGESLPMSSRILLPLFPKTHHLVPSLAGLLFWLPLQLWRHLKGAHGFHRRKHEERPHPAQADPQSDLYFWLFQVSYPHPNSLTS